MRVYCPSRKEVLETAAEPLRAPRRRGQCVPAALGARDGGQDL